MRAARKAPASMICAGSAGGCGTIFRVRVIQKRRRAVTSPECRRAAYTPVARLRRGITAGWPKSPGLGGHNALRAARCRRPIFRTSRPSAVAAAADVRMGMRGGAGGGASMP
jgi:hypothetical protein